MGFMRYLPFCNACTFVCIDRQYIFHGLREGTLYLRNRKETVQKLSKANIDMKYVYSFILHIAPFFISLMKLLVGFVSNWSTKLVC